MQSDDYHVSGFCVLYCSLIVVRRVPPCDGMITNMSETSIECNTAYRGLDWQLPMLCRGRGQCIVKSTHGWRHVFLVAKLLCAVCAATIYMCLRHKLAATVEKYMLHLCPVQRPQ